MIRVRPNSEVLRFDPTDGDAAAKAQLIIHKTDQLTDEQKCFAHFWSGYFYAYASGFYLEAEGIKT